MTSAPALLHPATSTQLRELLYDPRHLTARVLAHLGKLSGLGVDRLAQMILVPLAILLFVPPLAPLVANGLLITYPLAITYVYPEECLSRDHLLIYWTCFGLLTALDRVFEPLFGYYLLKMFALVLPFLEPWRLVDDISSFGQRSHRVPFVDQPATLLPPTGQCSPRPEKPEEERAHTILSPVRAPPLLSPSALALNAASDAPASPVETDILPSKKHRAAHVDLRAWPSSCPSDSVASSKGSGGGTMQWMEDEEALNRAVDRLATREVRQKDVPLPLAATPAETTETGSTATCTSTTDETVTSTTSSSSSLSGPATPAPEAPPPVVLQPPSDDRCHIRSAELVPFPFEEATIPTGLMSPPPEPATPTTSNLPTVKSEHDVLKPIQTAVTTSSETSVMQTARESNSVVDLAGQKRYKGENPMAKDPEHRLTVSEEKQPLPPLMSSSKFEPTVNPDDLVFFPSKEIVFNAPFDFDTITYHMQLRNNSNHSIAFAVKGNAIPRVMAYPPAGIIKSGKSMLIAVSLQKFDGDVADFAKDRIVFEYVVLKDELGDVKNFSHSLFQSSQIKRRKNIHVGYNP